MCTKLCSPHAHNVGLTAYFASLTQQTCVVCLSRERHDCCRQCHARVGALALHFFHTRCAVPPAPRLVGSSLSPPSVPLHRVPPVVAPLFNQKAATWTRHGYSRTMYCRPQVRAMSSIYATFPDVLRDVTHSHPMQSTQKCMACQAIIRGSDHVCVKCPDCNEVSAGHRATSVSGGADHIVAYSPARARNLGVPP